MECYKCGLSGNKARLFDVISLKEKGIVKLCSNCLKEEDMPILKRPTTFQLKKSEEKPWIRGKVAEEIRKKEIHRKSIEKTDGGLRELVDKNYEGVVSKEKMPRPDLVDNFHWILMRARRMRKLTQQQLAREISESEAAVKMAEHGILPEDDNRIVNKLESFLGIRIRKSDIPFPERKEPIRIIKFNPDAAKDLTISDLQRIKEARETEILDPDVKVKDSGEQPEIEIEYEDNSEKEDEW